MRNRKDLRAYQVASADFIREKKRVGLFVDPGLGKTATTLTAFGDLIDDLECGMTLIVAPPRVARKTWPDEFREWAHVNDKSFVHITGSIAKRRLLLKRKVCYHIISVDLLPWLLKELGGHAPDRGRIKKLLGGDETIVTLEQRVNALVAAGVPREALAGKDADEVEKVAAREAKLENKWRPPARMIYDAIVVDESSKLKSHASNRFRAARLLARHVEYFVILTGTPAANGYIDLWAQIYLLDFGKRLGENITAFRDRWFKQNFNGHGYKVQDYAVKVIEERISDIVFTLREEDYANLPPRMYNDIVLEFDEATAKKYKEFEKTYVLELQDEKMLTVQNGAAISNKLQQLSNGFVYDELKQTHFFHKVKLDALEELVDEVHGQPVLVAYQFVADAERILKRFPQAEMFTDDPKVQDRWNAGEIPMLLVHPASAAHGLNLQFGGNVAVWYGLTWNLEHYIQLNKRLHRSGQKRTVMIHHLAVKGTIDEDMLTSLAGKNDTQESLLNALKKRIKLYV